ncbi:transcription factor bHLH112 isoform X1 [Arachis duranensis]|uniref:Transcription factor bHLH112 isoform X1 n=1 Tax=Arachis duranensis TaxID=130453 RepID=A0A6P4CRQ9_ARADU|nr:transcription factor bHLH112 isoform X1 [Arachis duranensis]
MADDEDFQGAAGICGENWWRSIDSTRSVFPPLTSSSPSSTSPCSVAPPTDTRTWPSSDDHHHCFMDLKAPACDIISNNNNNNYHMSFHDAQEKPHNNKTTTNESQSGSMLIDSTFQMMGFGLSSPNWDHQSLLENNNSQIIQKDYWSRKNFGTQQQQVSSTMDVFKRMNNQEFSSSTYGYPSSTLIQTLYDPQQQPQRSSSSSSSLFTNRSMSYSSSSTVNYHHASDEVSLSPITWPKLFSSSSSSSSSSLSLLPPMAKHPDNNNIGLHFSNNNTPFWNASSDALHDIRAGAFPFEEEDNKPNSPIILLNKLKSEELCVDSVKKNNNVCSSPPPFKRARIETPPPLPTFKVRKEKLGDRVTALQQLVSPFGKTDTASVLHEAIEYIKFLHDQVSVLSTPYMKSGASIQPNQECNDWKESPEVAKRDLRSRGLCLVPISSTFPVATEVSADFWTPTLSFGGALLR